MKQYRYGFNGKEKDLALNSEGNTLDFGARIYDSRIGRFLVVDPLTSTYPFYTPYQYAGNMPVYTIDVDGLEPEKIINEAERLIGTPYEFGGKYPAPEMIGIIETIDGKKYWRKTLLPLLRAISFYHPVRFKMVDCGDKEKNLDWWAIRAATHKSFDLVHNSIGIDCSGFVYKAYKQDKDLLMSLNHFQIGSNSQLKFFKAAANKGKAYVHKDFNLISKGDFLHHKNHVMIATGNVKKDENGNVVEYETIEANSTDVGTVKMWRTVKAAKKRKTSIAHPFRTTDITGRPKSFFDFDPFDGDNGINIIDYTPEERTKKNKQQTTIIN